MVNKWRTQKLNLRWTIPVSTSWVISTSTSSSSITTPTTPTPTSKPSTTTTTCNVKYKHSVTTNPTYVNSLVSEKSEDSGQLHLNKIFGGSKYRKQLRFEALALWKSKERKRHSWNNWAESETKQRVNKMKKIEPIIIAVITHLDGNYIIIIYLFNSVVLLIQFFNNNCK